MVHGTGSLPITRTTHEHVKWQRAGYTRSELAHIMPRVVNEEAHKCCKQQTLYRQEVTRIL